MTFKELYGLVTQKAAKGDLDNIEALDLDENQMDCLLHPEKKPLVWKVNDCSCTDKNCVAACIFDAIDVVDSKITFNSTKCTGCAECIEACKNNNLTFSRDIIKAIEILKENSGPVYALIAPAFIGQFGTNATPAKIRTALMQIGFQGMLEVAAFADILTLKEALEFDANEDKGNEFQLTSCCCPIWISLIHRDFEKISSHLPPSVSPMIACGRVVKELHPHSKTIFIGPCLAKKAEAREKDIADAIDCVLTFEELNDLFHAFMVDFSALEDTLKEHASTAGRLYARSGGVSTAVDSMVKRIQSKHAVKPVCVNGVAECKKLLSAIIDGDIEGNFYEGMACVGGCVGGPKRILDISEGTAKVNEYADEAVFKTPLDNPYVLELINRLGFSSVEDFVKNSQILVRSFEK